MDIKELLQKYEELETPVLDSMEDETGMKEIVEKVNESVVDEEDDLGLYIQTTGSLYKKYLQTQIEKGTKIAWDRLVAEGAKLYQKEIENKKFTKEELKSAKEYIQDYYAGELSPEQLKDTGRKYQALTVKTEDFKPAKLKKAEYKKTDIKEPEVEEIAEGKEEEPAKMQKVEYKKTKIQKPEVEPLKENRYATEQDMYDGSVSEDEYLDSFEYIYSQKVNGNISDYRSKLIDLQVAGELRDYSAWCEELGCNPEIEKYLDNKDAEPSEDEDYEYIYSSLVNGNITQYKNQLRRLQSKGQLGKYKNYCQEMGVDGEVGRFLESLTSKVSSLLKKYDALEEGISEELTYTLDSKVKEFYVKKFPKDELGKEIPSDLTFKDVDENVGKIYSLLAPADDSIIRERVFEKLAEIKQVDYDEIYNKWLECDESLSNLKRGSKSAKLGELNKNESLTAEELKFNQDLFNTIKEECEKLGFNKCNEKTVKDGEDAGKELAVAYECEKDGFRHLIDYTTEWSDGNLTYRIFKDNKRVNEVRWSWTYSIEEIKKAFKDIARTFNSFNESFASLNAKLEAHLNEALSNWEEAYLPGTVNAIRLIAPVKFEGIDQQVVAYIFKNKEQFSHKFGYELTIENGGGSSIISNGDSDFANEAVNLCLTAIKEFDKENDTNIIYDVRPLEPSAEDIKYLNGEELKEDANLKPSISYDDREGKYVCFATENGGAVKYTDTKEDAEQFLIDKYGVKKEDIELIESFEDKTVNFMNKLLSYDVDNSDKNMLIITVGKGELKDSQGTPYYIQATRLKKGNDTRNHFMAVYDDGDDSVRLDDAEYIDCTQADFVNLNGMVDDALNCLNEAWSDAELAQVGAITEKPTKKYRIYQNGGGEIAVTTHTLNGIWALMDESDDFDYIDDRMNDDWSDANWTLYDEELLNDETAKEYFPMERYFADDENDLEYYHIYDLSQYYADKNESMNEVDKDKAEENNAKRQFNSLKADLKAEVTGDPKDQEEADKLANKATKSNKQLKSWKKAKGIKESKTIQKRVSKKESLNEEVVAKFDNGLHEIIRNADGKYYNRYNIKEGKARFTTKPVKNLPTALGALKKRFPNAEEVRDEE